MSRFQSLRALWLRFWHTLRGHPLDRAQDAYVAAVKLQARCYAEVVYQRALHDHHYAEATAIDPRESHLTAQAYANARKAQHDSQQDWDYEIRRHAEARAKAEACKARLEQLQEGQA